MITNSKYRRFLIRLLGGLSFVWAAIVLLPCLPEPIGSRSTIFITGVRVTILLSLCSGLIGLAVGVLLGFAKLSGHVVLRMPAYIFVWFLRGTPLVVQILFVYYMLPICVPLLKLSELNSAIIALACNVGAYNAEVVRAAIIAIPKGQVEAGLSLGLSNYQTMRYVVFPQAFKIMFPALVNNFIALIKDSSLASSIGLLELSLAASRISSETFQPIPALATVAIIYLILTSFTSWLTYCIEGSFYGRTNACVSW